MNFIKAINYETLHSLKITKLIPYIKKEQDFNMPLNINLIGSLTNIDKEEIKNCYQNYYWAFKKIESIKPKVQIQYLSNEIVPYFLYQGKLELLKTNCIAIVGTRTPSPYAREECNSITSYLGSNNFTIISGLAKGIDSIAHLKALEKSLNTIAIIATPINKYYPKENEKLQKQISKEGLLISPFSPKSITKKWHFLLRNKLMVNISLASVLIEAFDGGGATRLAEYSVKVNHPVFIPKIFYENKVTTWQKKLSPIYPYQNYSDILKALNNKALKKKMEKRIQSELF